MNTEIKDPATEEGYSIYHDLEISAPVQKVFQAITAPNHLINWWPLKCSGKPEKDAEYNFYFGPEFNWFGKVKELVKSKSFHIKMTQSDPDWDPTSFGFDLEQNGNKVLVKFWHIGWPSCNKHYRRSSFCWALLLNGLKNYIEEGVIIPFDERA